MTDVENLETVYVKIEVEFGIHENCMRGRNGYGTGVRPNHWIPGRSYCFIGQVNFKDIDWLEPGKTCLAQIDALVAKQDLAMFVKGFSWHVCEASNIVGYATTISIAEQQNG